MAVTVVKTDSQVVVQTPGPAGPSGSAFTPAADAGSGSPVATQLRVTGGSNISTSVSGTTVTINSDVSGTVTSVTPAGDNGSGTAITSSGTLTVAGTAPISTSVSGSTITVTHDNASGSGVSTGFPAAIEIDSKGHVVSVGSSAPPAQAANNLSDLANAGTARTNLGLGSSSTLDVPSSGDAASGEVVKGNDTRLTDARTPVAHSAALITSGTLAVAQGGTGLSSISTLLNSNTTKSDVGLGNVENTAISTFAGTDQITTLGTITTGTWSGTAIGYASLSGKPSLGTASQYNTGVGSDNMLQANAAVADNDFLRVDGTKIEGRTAAETLLDIGASPVAGSSSIVTTGTIASGTWNATAIEDTKLDLRVDHGATFDGQGSAITASESVLVPVERAGVIKAASLVGDASGTITITVKRYTPSSGSLNSATSLGTIALSSAQHARDTTLSGWTTSLSAGDVLEFVTTATIATVTRVTVKLKVELA